jgi:nucleoside 2-deoxyribosyltransferase
MWYHAVGYYGDKSRCWWNRNRDDIITDILVPFVSKQVKVLTRGGISSLFNFGAADYITLLKTPDKLRPPTGQRIPSELEDPKFLQENCATDEFVKEMKQLVHSPRTRSLLEQSTSAPRKQIFVIMKFADEDMDSAYEGVIKPLGNEFGYEVLRVDEIQNSGNINQQILEGIASSEIVLADLTGERPNCYYEAGFAHAIGKELVFSIKTGSPIHFDLAAYRFINWRTEAEYRTKLRERLESVTSKRSG